VVPGQGAARVRESHAKSVRLTHFCWGRVGVLAWIRGGTAFAKDLGETYWQREQIK